MSVSNVTLATSMFSNISFTGLGVCGHHSIQRSPKTTVHCSFKAALMLGFRISVKVDLPDICGLIKKFFSVFV